MELKYLMIFLVFLGMILTLGTLVIGLIGKRRDGQFDKSRDNRFMWFRVGCQLFTVLALVGLFLVTR